MTSVLREENQSAATRDVLEGRRESEANDLPEAEAVRLARRGNAQAFERVYQLHCRKVYGLCRRMARNFAEAEDLTQEAFLQVFRKIHTFRGDSSFSTWLYRVAVNVVLMNLRKRRKGEISLEEINDPDEETGAPREPIATRDLALAGALDRVNLQRAVDQLPPGCRTVFVLHDILGHEHKGIGKILRCSAGNSKSQVHKARRRLRDILRQGRRKPSRQKLDPGSLEPVPT